MKGELSTFSKRRHISISLKETCGLLAAIQHNQFTWAFPEATKMISPVILYCIDLIWWHSKGCRVLKARREASMALKSQNFTWNEQQTLTINQGQTHHETTDLILTLILTRAIKYYQMTWYGKLTTIKSLKADVSSISPLSEGMMKG